MVDPHKDGISTNSHSPSELDTTTNHGISKTPEEPITCKFGQLTHNGSSYSNTRLTISATLMPEEESALKFNMERTLKVNQLW
jgi:hypothetical protein